MNDTQAKASFEEHSRKGFEAYCTDRGYEFGNEGWKLWQAAFEAGKKAVLDVLPSEDEVRDWVVPHNGDRENERLQFYGWLRDYVAKKMEGK